MKNEFKSLAEKFFDLKKDLHSSSIEDIRDFFYEQSPSSDENGFQRFLYELKKKNFITSSGSGIYIIHGSRASLNRKPFNPMMSPFLVSVKEKVEGDLQKLLPYSHFVFWETRVLYDLMIHQPGNNIIIFNTEKESARVLFGYLNEILHGQVFIFPSKEVINDYALLNKEVIIIERLISKSPRRSRQGNFTYAKIEQILVDIFVDRETFSAYQGNEMINIYSGANEKYLIDERSLFNYAKRRNSEQRLRSFYQENTSSKL